VLDLHFHLVGPERREFDLPPTNLPLAVVATHASIFLIVLSPPSQVDSTGE
jgi:hypothetical protein